MAGGAAGRREGRSQREKAFVPFPSQRKDWERVPPEPVTLVDKDVTGHSALCGWQVPHAWKVGWPIGDEDSEREDYIVPSDYALGEISRLHYCVRREEPSF